MSNCPNPHRCLTPGHDHGEAAKPIGATDLLAALAATRKADESARSPLPTGEGK